MKIEGHHHVSMHAKNGKTTDQFYQDVLGFRRVKKTVNQDDPRMYHLFYGDQIGTPGTELTFFEMPRIGQTYRGTNAISHVGLLVPSDKSITFWGNRFKELDVEHHQVTKIHGRKALYFEDPDKLQLYLFSNEGLAVNPRWDWAPHAQIPQEHQILGMGPTILSVRDLEKSRRVLLDILGYQEVVSTDNEAVFRAVATESFGEIIVRQVDGERERPGRGSVHHLAITVKDKTTLQEYWQLLEEKGFRNSGIVDRYYFTSLYFRDPNSILYELATDGPGFTVDSTVEELGKQLDLPPFLEARRAEIEATLEPLD